MHEGGETLQRIVAESTAVPAPGGSGADLRRHAPQLLLVSGRSHPALADRIAGELGCDLGRAELETFANGDVYCRYPESMRGADVFIVQSGQRLRYRP